MHKESIQGWLKHADFMILDFIMMQVCFVSCYLIIRGIRNPYHYTSYRYLAVLIFGAQIIVATMGTPYKNILRRGRFEELVAITEYVVGVFFLIVAFLFVIQRSVIISRLQFGSTLVSFVIVALVIHSLHKRLIKWSYARSANIGKRSILLVTSVSLVNEALEKLQTNYMSYDYFISGIVLLDRENPKVSEYKGIPILGYNGEVLRAIVRSWVDEVFFLQPDDMTYPTELMNAIIEMGLQVHYTMSVLNSDKLAVTNVQKLGDYRVLTSSAKSISLRDAFFKRCLDLVGGLVGCLLTLIIVMIVGPIIKKQSPGPVFFKQKRIGKNGKVFEMYKLRSMYMDAEERKAALMAQNKIEDGMMFKMDDDPRIIGSEKKDKNGRPKGIGNFIRNTSLDEFPQFFNVLKGNMSLVGTRPPTLDEWEKYNLEHRIRMSIKPGITGLWQVSGRSDITDFDEVVKLDRQYIEEWTPLLDIRILLKTILVVLTGKGAE